MVFRKKISFCSWGYTRTNAYLRHLDLNQLNHASLCEYGQHTYWHKIWQRCKNDHGCWYITTLFKERSDIFEQCIRDWMFYNPLLISANLEPALRISCPQQRFSITPFFFPCSLWNGLIFKETIKIVTWKDWWSKKWYVGILLFFFFIKDPYTKYKNMDF